MVETRIGPSELHLKKELTALRKSRLLRDPETCSSWRSPLSSRSVVTATNKLIPASEIKDSILSAGCSNDPLEVEHQANLPLRSENRRKKVYLYNWIHSSSKSSANEMKLDDSNRGDNVLENSEDVVHNSCKMEFNDDTSVEESAAVFNAKNTDLLTTLGTGRKIRARPARKQQNSRDVASSKGLDLPSSYLEILNSTELSDGTECCNSEDLQRKMQELIQRSANASQVASPLLSISGCGQWSNSSKILDNARRNESSYSCTPVSARSYNRNGENNTSNFGSWDGTMASFHEDQVDLPGRQGCGLPCYTSKRKSRGHSGWYSPSLSDKLRRKGSSILCGSQTRNHRRRQYDMHKKKPLSKSLQGMPLLTNSDDEERSSEDSESDEPSTNFGELQLEGLSRLDGRRWSNCRSSDLLELALPDTFNGVMSDHRSLSQKYRPRFFEEIIGQNIVIQSLNNAILRGRIAPAYLFQGPRGTGKTSVARVFAAALNCSSTELKKPCGFCRECTDFASGNGSNIREVDAVNKKEIDRVRYLLESFPISATLAPYKVFVIDECHMLSSKLWSAFMKFLEEPPSGVVFVFITIDPDRLPRAILSRCQRYLFPKIKDVDIVSRLRKLSAEERLDVELEALDLIALNSDGSLRDAEMMLEQLSLLGKKITTSLVHDLAGVVSDEKLLELLEVAMSSDTAETVRRSRELLDSGIDPIALMSQLAGLIMDIIAGSRQIDCSKSSDLVHPVQTLSENELDRLQQALKIISDAEKQLRHSSERSTWFTAALLRLGSGNCLESVHPCSSNGKHSSKSKTSSDTMIEDLLHKRTQVSLNYQHSNSASIPKAVSGKSSSHANTSFSVSIKDNTDFDDLPISSATSPKDDANHKRMLRCVSPEKLEEVWKKCIEGCHSKTLRHLLCNHGKLVSISEAEGVLIAFIAFGDSSIKSRAERFLSSITNSIETVLRQNVEVKFGILPAKYMSGAGISQVSAEQKQPEEVEMLIGARSGTIEINRPKKNISGRSFNISKKSAYCNRDESQETADNYKNSDIPDGNCQITDSSNLPCHRNGLRGIKGKQQEVATERSRNAVTNEQKLETAWLQVAEKVTPVSTTSLKPQRHQILPQNGSNIKKENEYSMTFPASSKHWEDELNHEIKALKIQGHLQELGGGTDTHTITPSILHSNTTPSNFGGDKLDYDSGPGCNGLLCWKAKKSLKVKVKRGTLLRSRSQKSGRVSCFGRGRSKASQNRPEI